MPEDYSERVFHIHLRIAGDNGEFVFCNYLNEHPDVTKEYERLKLRLCRNYEHDRDSRTYVLEMCFHDLTSKFFGTINAWKYPQSHFSTATFGLCAPHSVICTVAKH